MQLSNTSQSGPFFSCWSQRIRNLSVLLGDPKKSSKWSSVLRTSKSNPTMKPRRMEKERLSSLLSGAWDSWGKSQRSHTLKVNLGHTTHIFFLNCIFGSGRRGVRRIYQPGLFFTLVACMDGAEDSGTPAVSSVIEAKTGRHPILFCVCLFSHFSLLTFSLKLLNFIWTFKVSLLHVIK